MNRTSINYLYRFLLAFSGLLFHYLIAAQPSVKGHTPELYGIFNNSLTLETRIVPIFIAGMEIVNNNHAEGFQIPEEKFSRTVGEYYGSASLAGDPNTGQFFYANKSGESPALWVISAAGEHEKLKTPLKKLKGHCFTKMAMGPDGFVYAISTGIKHGDLPGENKTLVVRFKPANGHASETVEIVGYLSAKDGYHNVSTYSGDMAFSAAGDLFIFGTTLDTAINYYTGAHIYKIASADLRQMNNKAPIPIKYIGDISGMGVQTGIDSTIITGIAFQSDGSFVLSAIDKYTNTRVHFYRGTSLANTTKVLPVKLDFDLPPGFVISDLTSFSLPVVKVIQQKKPANTKIVTKLPENNWEKSVTLSRVSY
jgi:hypothetical protein